MTKRRALNITDFNDFFFQKNEYPRKCSYKMYKREIMKSKRVCESRILHIKKVKARQKTIVESLESKIPLDVIRYTLSFVDFSQKQKSIFIDNKLVTIWAQDE